MKQVLPQTVDFNHGNDDFARKIAIAELGKHYSDPRDAEFQDRDPGARRSVKKKPETWHKLGAVAADVLRDLIHQHEDGEAA